MLTLYQFPISHFCEKARWALDYKKLEHRKVTVLPGLHVAKMKKMTGKSNVPVLKHDKHTIQGSAQIIDYLDTVFESNLLTPEDESLKAKASEWESFADNKIGPQVRLVVYHIMLDYPEIVIPFFTQQGPIYGPLLMKKMFPKMKDKMREYMSIDDENAAKCNRELIETVDNLANHYAQHEYMVGDTFSRADLTAAALLAPIVMPDKYGIDWPTEIPQRMTEFAAQFDGKLDWVSQFYSHYR